MYELPIKRAGLSMNRILLSNTKMVGAGFPKMKEQQFTLNFKYRVFENGKQVGASKCKYFTIKTFVLHVGQVELLQESFPFILSE